MHVVNVYTAISMAYPEAKAVHGFRYQFEEMILHWGNEGEGGSEHSINGNFFPAEIQVQILRSGCVYKKTKLNVVYASVYFERFCNFMRF